MDSTRAGLVIPTSRARPSFDMLVPHLRHFREMRTLSQSELGQRAGVSRATVMKLEAGRNAWPQTIRKLARALGVKPEELTGRGRET